MTSEVHFSKMDDRQTFLRKKREYMHTYREKHRDEINRKQKAAYHQWKLIPPAIIVKRLFKQLEGN